MPTSLVFDGRWGHVQSAKRLSGELRRSPHKKSKIDIEEQGACSRFIDFSKYGASQKQESCTCCHRQFIFVRVCMIRTGVRRVMRRGFSIFLIFSIAPCRSAPLEGSLSMRERNSRLSSWRTTWASNLIFFFSSSELRHLTQYRSISCAFSEYTVSVVYRNSELSMLTYASRSGRSGARFKLIQLRVVRIGSVCTETVA